MSLKPIRQRTETLAEIAYARLCNALIDGTLRPGERLVMDRLGADLNISRTPVREALQRLERERVIQSTGGKGYVVCSLNSEELDQMYDAREAVEAYAAVVVAKMGSESHDNLQREFEHAGRMPRRTPVETYMANRYIHRAVLVAAGNLRLTEMFDLVWSRGLPSQVWAELTVNGALGSDDLYASHKELLEAIVSGSSRKAHAAAVSHIRAGRKLHLPDS